MTAKEPKSKSALNFTRVGARCLGIAGLICLLLICQAIPADAFGPTGHRVVAKIAEAHLTPRTKLIIKEILGTESLIQVSTWADEIRSDPRWRHASPWHYVSIKDGGSYVAGPMKGPKNPKDIIQAITHFRAILKDSSREKKERAQALKWLVHLIGDIHQPLHVGRAFDKGGNEVKATWFGEETNVHVIWDEGLIDSTKLSYTELASFINKATEKEKAAWRNSDVMDWAKESMAHRKLAYEVPRSNRSGSYAYAFKHLPLLKTRLNQAGVRLAAVLNAVLDDGVEAGMAPALHWQRNSAEYRALALQSYRGASKSLKELHAQGDSATRKNWGVVLDADETIFDNSTYFKERGAAGLSSKSWDKWCKKRAAGAVPGAVEFMSLVQKLGGKIAIVSNRSIAIQAETEANLKRLGAPFDVLLLRKGTFDKAPRWRSLKTGEGQRGPLRVVMFVGDNIHDFPGLSQSSRDDHPQSLDQFGQRFILLPNPMYGSWQENKPR